MYSSPLSELVGAVVGTLVGEVSTKCTDLVSDQLKLTKPQAKFVAVFTGHFCSSLASKLAINLSTADVVSATTISPMSSAMLAGVHAATKVAVQDGPFALFEQTHRPILVK